VTTANPGKEALRRGGSGCYDGHGSGKTSGVPLMEIGNPRRTGQAGR
jgi:hypothetical protein